MFNFFKKEKEIILKSPIKGEIIKLENVEDQVFATKVLGDGIAIKPTEGKVFSPVNGIVETIFPTKHAIGIKLNNGIEVLIHIGINTVELKGEFFNSHIECGSKVSVGELLIEFDINGITEKGYNITTPIIITNMEGFSKIDSFASGNVEIEDDLFRLVK